MKQVNNRLCVNEWNRHNIVGIIISMIFGLSVIGVLVIGNISILLNSSHLLGNIIPLWGIPFSLFVGGLLIHHLLLKHWVCCFEDKILIETQLFNFKTKELKSIPVSAECSIQLTSRQQVGQSRYLELLGKKEADENTGGLTQIDYLLLLNHPEGAQLIQNNTRLNEIEKILTFIQEQYPQLTLDNQLEQGDTVTKHQELNRYNIRIVVSIILLLIMTYFLGSQLVGQDLTLDLIQSQPLSYGIIICLVFIIDQIRRSIKSANKLKLPHEDSED